MTNSLLTVLGAALVGLAMSSCYPIGPPQPPTQPPSQPQLTPEQIAAQELQRQRIAEREAELRRQQLEFENQDTSITETTPPGPSDYRFAKPVPGKPGFVFSPYNNTVLDVRNMASGTLVSDPTYPESEKKYFRVP